LPLWPDERHPERRQKQPHVQGITNKNLSTGVSGEMGISADPSLHLVFLPRWHPAPAMNRWRNHLQEIERLKKTAFPKPNSKARHCQVAGQHRL
jgi:hypothetical protein